MKRARVTTRSEAARARARPRSCPVSPDALPALLDGADVVVRQLCASAFALASLTADLVARKDEWVQQVFAQLASFRSALLARKTLVLGKVKRLVRKQCKRVVADSEAVDASSDQLRVWAGVTGAGTACPDVDCVFAASPLLASLQLAQSPAAGVNSIIALSLAGELGSVAVGDGLRVLNAAGPGLKWFEPQSRNEFSVVLAQADGCVPVWLSTGDVTVAVRSAADNTPSGLHTAACNAGHGTVSIVYDGLTDDVSEVVLQLTVCGVVAAAAGDGAWGMCVPARPLAGHQCAAVGTHVRTLDVVAGYKRGMAVSADEKWLVVGLFTSGMLYVYSLPGVELMREFGGRGSGPLQFMGLYRLCFTPNGNLIVVDRGNRRLQEVALEGVFVRFIGVGMFCDGKPCCVAVHDDVIAVGCDGGAGPRVVLLDYDTGAVTSRFGVVGAAPGRLNNYCTGIRITPDGSHVVVAEHDAQRLSVFTTAGEFVRCVGVGVLGRGLMDVLQSVTGEYVVADPGNCRVCVFSPDGLELIRSWGSEGTGDGQFQCPTALAAAGQHLYVMDAYQGRVQVLQ